MKPCVSVVMAAKNYARFLPMAVRSVQGQSFPNWELIVVDDGSTDDTQLALKPFLNDVRVRSVASDRLGQSRAKNLGVRLCRGKYIAFLDADDAWRPSKLMKQLAAIGGSDRLGVVATERELITENFLFPSPLGGEGLGVRGDCPVGLHFESFQFPSPLGGEGLGVRGDCPVGLHFESFQFPSSLGGEGLGVRGDCPVGLLTDGKSRAASAPHPQPLSPKGRGEQEGPKGRGEQENPEGRGEQISLDAIYTHNPICFSSVFVRREVFDQLGGFDADLDLSIDYDLWLRVASHYDIACLPEKLTLYRTGHGNLSKRMSDRIATAFTIMQRAERRGMPVSRQAKNEGYTSTCQSMAWLRRGDEPREAMRWYFRSLSQPGQRMLALKGIAGTLLDRFRPSRAAMMAENRRENA